MKLTCVHPVLVFRDREHHSDAIKVPCGKCVACRRKKSLDWCTRCTLESMDYPYGHSFFLTLTYADDYLPSDGVRKRDLQLYLKRLRYRIHPYKLRYYACGEYGSRTHRPHYHMLVFSDSLTEDVFSHDWSFGYVSVGYVSPSSIAYTTGYCNKSFEWPDGKNRTFRLMSRKPGLGYEFFLKNRDWLERDDTVLPRYFMDKLYPPESEIGMSMRAQRERYLLTLYKHELEESVRNHSRSVYHWRRDCDHQRELDLLALQRLKDWQL